MKAFTRFLSSYGRVYAALLVFAATLAIFIGGAQPFAINLIPSPWDKFLHVAVFGAVGAALGFAIGIRRRGVVFVATIGTLVIGALDEWH